jgi:Bacterial protein of unknown function (DUF899)
VPNLHGCHRRRGRQGGGRWRRCDRPRASREALARRESSDRANAHVTFKEQNTMSASRRVVSREEWIQARRALLAKEKTFTRERDGASYRW